MNILTEDWRTKLKSEKIFLCEKCPQVSSTKAAMWTAYCLTLLLLSLNWFSCNTVYKINKPQTRDPVAMLVVYDVEVLWRQGTPTHM